MNDNPAPAPSVREAAFDLLAALSGGSDRIALAQRIRLREALRRTRPDSVPDIATALATIDAMKAGKPIAPGGIQAIVALAEEGARQLDQFAVRFDADRRALAAWAEAHPELSAWVPEREDAIVWLMELFDCRFSDPTVAKVNGVRARLGAARLRAPNQLTSDACDIIDQLVEALRKATRGEFIAQQRVAELERAVPGESALSDHLDALRLLADAAELLRTDETDDRRHGEGLLSIDPDGAAIHLEKASRRGVMAAKIEAFVRPPDHLPDLGALIASPSGADALAYGLASPKVSKRFADPFQTFSAAEHDADQGALSDDLHERLVDILGRELGDAHDCTRVWSAWNEGTMTAADFEPVSDRIDDIAAALVAVIKPADLPEPTGEPIAMRKVETHRAGVVEQTTISTIYGERPRPGPASDSAFDALVDAARESGVINDKAKVIWREPGEAGKLLATKLSQLTGYEIRDRKGRESLGEAAPDPDAPIGGKNTADYDRRQMEDRINAILKRQSADGVELTVGEIGDAVHRIAPGWEWAQAMFVAGEPIQIILMRYAPNEPI